MIAPYGFVKHWGVNVYWEKNIIWKVITGMWILLYQSVALQVVLKTEEWAKFILYCKTGDCGGNSEALGVHTESCTNKK